ncbi:MAG: LysM peptidoglycan-binding domain-containing protein [Thiothrix sp.]|nr:LysM peptidoglycan-binding domain-containing protein [Thiothrix sp.]HPQ94320.1 LysM domain-containing protein [Thiolinea sp.]
MDRKITLLATTSVVALMTTACAPNGQYGTPQGSSPSVPSAAASTGGSYDSTGVVTHSHGGKVHSHKLPASGLNHSHTLGSGTTPTPAPAYQPPAPVYRPPTPAPVYQPPAAPVPQPAPVQNYQPPQNGAVTHSHGGKVHSHRLPASGLNHTHNIGGSNPNPAQAAPVPMPQYNNVPQYGTPPQYNQPAPVATQPAAQGVTHSHCGRAHTHPLPAQGLNHTHTNINCTAGGQSVTPPPQQRPQVQPQVPYDYSSPTSANTSGNSSATYYDNAASNPAGTTTTGNNYYNDYNATPPAQGSYYDSARPKQPVSYGDTSTSYYDYTPPKANTGTTTTTTSDAFAPSNFSGGDTYTVQRGDTVFQVMRNTGVYWKDIIRLNNLQAPNYQINPGQQLRLR